MYSFTSLTRHFEAFFFPSSSPLTGSTARHRSTEASSHIVLLYVFKVKIRAALCTCQSLQTQSALPTCWWIILAVCTCQLVALATGYQRADHSLSMLLISPCIHVTSLEKSSWNKASNTVMGNKKYSLLCSFKYANAKIQPTVRANIITGWNKTSCIKQLINTATSGWKIKIKIKAWYQLQWKWRCIFPTLLPVMSGMH